jgi:hypothetical protein
MTDRITIINKDTTMGVSGETVTTITKAESFMEVTTITDMTREIICVREKGFIDKSFFMFPL